MMNQYAPIPRYSILAATLPYSPIAYIPGKAEFGYSQVRRVDERTLAAVSIPLVSVP